MAEEVDDGLYRAWTRLALLAARPSPYAMPQFVLPASKWLTPGNPARIAIIEHRGAGHAELLGIGCFTRHRPTLFAPFPHLRCYRTPHSFQDGLLHVEGTGHVVAQALLDALRKDMPAARAIAFRNVAADDALFDALCGQAGAAGHGWHQLRDLQRPVLGFGPETIPPAQVPRRVARDVARKHRRLQAVGKVSFRLLQGDDVTDEAIERHLDIEHMGWKREAASSMRSSVAATGFFREMCHRFRAIGSTVLCETLLDGRVIASASALRAGDVLNAFKTGHDPGFADNSPGRMNIHALVGMVPEALPDVRIFDSNSRGDSFTGAMLPGRRSMLTGFLPLDRFARRALMAARLVRPVAYRIDDDP